MRPSVKDDLFFREGDFYIIGDDIAQAAETDRFVVENSDGSDAQILVLDVMFPELMDTYSASGRMLLTKAVANGLLVRSQGRIR